MSIKKEIEELSMVYESAARINFWQGVIIGAAASVLAFAIAAYLGAF